MPKTTAVITSTGNMQPTYIRGVHRDVYLTRYQRVVPAPALLFPELPTIKAAA